MFLVSSRAWRYGISFHAGAEESGGFLLDFMLFKTSLLFYKFRGEILRRLCLWLYAHVTC